MAIVGNCAFCTTFGKLTEEDIFARWMKRVIPRCGAEKQTRGLVKYLQDKTGNPVALQVTHNKSGHAASLRIPCVCAKCNNGWMSRLEFANIPILTKLIAGERAILFPFQMKRLATWAAKTVMAAEFYDETRIAIPQEQRTELMQGQLPPLYGWSIWIAPYQGPRYVVQMLHHVLHLIPRGPGKQVRAPGPLNAHATVITLGHVAFYIVGTTSEGHNRFTLVDEERSDFRRIWPVPSRIELWPSGRTMGRGDLFRLVDSFNHAIGVPPLKFW